MCGIYGCIKNDFSNNSIDISTIILKGLNILKNRGYDSCGIYLNNSNSNSNSSQIIKLGIDGDIIKLKENANKTIFDVLDNLFVRNNLAFENSLYTLGFGHTRWATHGAKTDYNSHPHVSNNKQFILVHNGIVSNFNTLKEIYLSNYTFSSTTDSEVIVNMIEYLYKQDEINTSLLDVLNILTKLYLNGTWACIIHNIKEPNKLYFIKNGCPLVIGKTKNDSMYILTSEPSGFMNLVDNYFSLEDGCVGYIGTNELFISGDYNQFDTIKLNDTDLTLDPKYKFWMYKEIKDQMKLDVFIDPLVNMPRFTKDQILFNINGLLTNKKYLYILGCGSSFYAGLLAENMYRKLGIFKFINVIDAGEFNSSYLKLIDEPEENLLVMYISQSGETRDLIVASDICHKYNPNIKTIGIINVIGSLLSTKTSYNIYTNCGKENSVASTKSFTSQVIACNLFGLYTYQLKHYLEYHFLTYYDKVYNDLSILQLDISKVLQQKDHIQQIAKKIIANKTRNMFILGKDNLHGIALEGALKIKEVSYFHAEGFNLTSLKHGPYSLIESNTPIIVLYNELNHSVKSVIEEIKTREAFVIEISHSTDLTENNILVSFNETFYPILTTICLQLLAYYMSIEQGINPDTPRNLAKVVTVD
uniref:glutamine--fructose-6-phosphate transaminase (isomerizing) n=1 Tax=viral metagenome TaxID=1070528 RepID=A0A6C0IU22_9ZZZZ